MNDTQTTQPAAVPRSRSWWRGVIWTCIWTGGVASIAYQTDPKTLHLSPRLGFALSLLVGLFLGFTWDALWPRDLAERLLGPSLGIALTGLLTLIPAGEFMSSELGSGLVLGTIAAVVIGAARRQYGIFGGQRLPVRRR